MLWDFNYYVDLSISYRKMHNAFGVSDGYHFFPSDESPPTKINKSPPSKTNRSPPSKTSKSPSRGPTTVDVNL